MGFKLTAEQQAIIDAAKNSTENLLVNALAGAAKTSTLVEIAQALPDEQMLCLAFNKKVAMEMQERLPDNCQAMTLNSLGHRVWSKAIGRRLIINSKKGYDIMKDLIEHCDPEDQSDLYPKMGDLMRHVAFGKACGYIPTDTYMEPPVKARRLMDDEEFFNHLEAKLNSVERKLIRDATLISLKQAFQGQCDYDDQILMPTVFFGSFPRFPVVLVDEAQDLSALNHAMLRKMVKGRLIAVGDPCQAIYGFRGAHEESMDLLREEFDMREMTLSISFRCPQKIVEASRWRAPNMQWPEWAKEGQITSLNEWGAHSLPESAAVICRNNAPLFALAIKLLKNGRHAELGGRDVVKTLTNIMRKFGSSDMSQMQVLDRIASWEEAQLENTKERGHAAIKDRAECMRIFARQGETLGDMMAYAQHLMHMSSPIKLMTGHKAKGLEFDHVFFLDNDLIGKEHQDPNIRYVILTRAKETLTYVELEDFEDAI